MDDKITLTVFTDLMMGLSYESEPIIDRLQQEYAERIEIRYVMALLVRDVSDFILNHRNRPAVYVLNLYIPPGFNIQDHFVDYFFCPLELHGHAAVPFVPDTAGTGIQIGGIAGTIAEATPWTQP